MSIRAQKVGLVFLRDDCQKVFLFVGGDFAPREAFSWWCRFRLVSSSDELHLWTVGVSLCCVTVWSTFLLGEGFLSDQLSMTAKLPLVRLQSSVFTGSQTSVCNTWWGWGFLLWALCDKALHPTGIVALCFGSQRRVVEPNQTGGHPPFARHTVLDPGGRLSRFMRGCRQHARLPEAETGSWDQQLSLFPGASSPERELPTSSRRSLEAFVVGRSSRKWL